MQSNGPYQRGIWRTFCTRVQQFMEWCHYSHKTTRYSPHEPGVSASESLNLYKTLLKTSLSKHILKRCFLNGLEFPHWQSHLTTLWTRVQYNAIFAPWLQAENYRKRSVDILLIIQIKKWTTAMLVLKWKSLLTQYNAAEVLVLLHFWLHLWGQVFLTVFRHNLWNMLL